MRIRERIEIGIIMCMFLMTFFIVPSVSAEETSEKTSEETYEEISEEVFLSDLPAEKDIRFDLLKTTESSPESLTFTWTGVLDIYIENGLYTSIQTALNTYISDLQAENYTVTVFNWTGTAAQLRTQLQNRYSSNNLEGAVFIGDLPTLTFDHEYDAYQITFIHDLYFMDLDGEYQFDVNGSYDYHYDGTGDVKPEIYVSRITTSPITGLTGKTETELINDYLGKTHAYRTGTLTYKNRGFTWSDDDWSSDKSWTMTNLYDEVGTIYLDEESTRESYENLLSLNYESILEQSHGSPTYHAAGGSSTDIYNLNPRAAFYNLFSCSSGRFTVTNNLLCTYVYGGDYGLHGVGTTKTGSMLYFQNYYNPMGDGDNMGQAFIEWFELYTRETTSANYYYNSWFMGMTIQGDPTLRPKTMGDPSNEPGPSSDPIPANASTGVNINADLSWTIGTGATSHDVYFGTDSIPDVTEFQGNQAGTTFDPGVLEANTSYYWRIDEVNASGTTTGLIWSFTTGGGAITIIASDDFESGDGSGGTGWLSSWSLNSDTKITKKYYPYEGTYHLQAHSEGIASRAVDMTGVNSPQLKFQWKAYSFETGEYATVEIQDDGTIWSQVLKVEDGEDDYVYHSANIDLSSFDMVSNFKIRIVMHGSNSVDRFFVDAIVIEGMT